MRRQKALEYIADFALKAWTLGEVGGTGPEVTKLQRALVAVHGSVAKFRMMRIGDGTSVVVRIAR